MTRQVRDSQASPPGAPPTRRTLLVRLKNWRDEESWHEFYRIYEKLIQETALRAGLTNVEAQEVVQETLLSVAKKIAGFDYDPEVGSFRGWLLRITRRRIVDQLRKRRTSKELPPATAGELLDQVSDPAGSPLEALWNEEWHQVLLEMARTMVRRKVGSNQYRMFEMYAMQRKPMTEVTKALRVNRAQVYMAKYRVTQLLKREIKQLEEETI